MERSLAKIDARQKRQYCAESAYEIDKSTA